MLSNGFGDRKFRNEMKKSIIKNTTIVWWKIQTVVINKLANYVPKKKKWKKNDITHN